MLLPELYSLEPHLLRELLSLRFCHQPFRMIHDPVNDLCRHAHIQILLQRLPDPGLLLRRYLYQILMVGCGAEFMLMFIYMPTTKPTFSLFLKVLL